MQRLPRIIENLLSEGGDKIVFLAEKLRLAQLSTLREKIGCHLMDLSQRQGSPVITPLYTKTVLAELFGVSRPALSRCFSALTEEGYLEEDDQGNLITNQAKPLSELLG